MLRNSPLSVCTVAPTGCARARAAFSSASSRFSVSGVSRVASATCRGPVGSSTTTSSRHSSLSRKSMLPPRRRGRHLHRAQVLVVDDELAVALEDVQLDDRAARSLGGGSRKLFVSGMIEFFSMIFRNRPLGIA